MATLKSIKNKYLSASDGDVLGVTTNTENVSALSFKLATADSLSKFNLVDGFADDYQDATGVDASGSTNEVRDSSAKYYSGSSSAAANATGGSITTSGGNTIHTFNTAGNGSATNDFVVPGGSATVTYLVVAGGGSGGSGYGGGGGAGGFRTGTFSLGSGGIPATTYAITAGAGGVAAAYAGTGTSGSDSVFSTITSTGGGYGSHRSPGGAAGGSGGGGSDSYGGGAGNTPSTSPAQGTGGGTGPGNYGGGGGGATSGGSSGSSGVPGTGGGGTANSITGSSVTYAGGGGGGSASGSVPGAAGGAGGGGAGGKGVSPAGGFGPEGSHGVSGTDGLGAGGGGGGYDKGGEGGDGVVIASYTTNAFSATSYLNMTLVSNAYTAQAAPTTTRIVLDSLTAAGGTALNTDLKAYASRDNGTTFTQMTLADQGYLNPNSGIDGYTKLMLHCDGSNNGTTFTDSSFSAHTVTASGNAVTDTTYKKFGTAGYKCPATGDFLSISDSEDWNFGSGDFTIDCWLYRTGTSAYQTILENKTDGSNYWQWRYFGGSGNFDFTVTGAGAFSVNWTVAAFAQDTWVHHQLVRNGNSWYMFQNGTQVGGTQTQAAAVPDMTGNLILQGDSALGQPFVGYMDEFRISKGIARNTSNFVVPSGEYVQSRRLLSGSVDISGQPSGTNVKYKIETLNQSASKQTRLYGTSMAWA